MATRTYTGAAAGLWSVAGNWDTGVPVNGDTADIPTGKEVTFDVDQSGFANGITLTGAGIIRFVTDGTVTYMKWQAATTFTGDIYIGNSVSDPIPAPAGSTPIVATLAVNGNYPITTDFNLYTFGERRYPGYAIESKTDNTHIVLAGSGSLDWLRAGDIIGISDSTVRTTTASTVEFTVVSYTAATRTIELSASLARSVNQNSCTDHVMLISRNIQIIQLSGTKAYDLFGYTANGESICSGVDFKNFRYVRYYGGTDDIDTQQYLYCTNNSNGNFTNAHGYVLFEYCTSYDGGYLAATTSPSCELYYCYCINGSLIFSCAYCKAFGCIVHNYASSIIYIGNYCSAINCYGYGTQEGINRSGTNNYYKNCHTVYTNRGFTRAGLNLIFLDCSISDASSNYNLNQSPSGILKNCLFGANLDYDGTPLSVFSFAESIDHNQVSGSYYAWHIGGTVTTQAITVPSGFTSAQQVTLTNADNPVHRTIPILLQDGESVRFTVKIRKESSMSYLPRIQVLDQFQDTFYSDSLSVLSEVQMTDSISTWETLTITYENTSGDEMRLLLRIICKDASGTVYYAKQIELLSDVLTVASAIQDVTDKLDTMLEADGAVYRYTENALEEAGGTSAEEIRIEMDANSTKLANLDATVSSRSTLTAAQVNEQADIAIADAALATSAELADVQTHGDSNWATATGFATSTVQSQILKALINTKFLDDVNYKVIIYDDDETTPLFEFYTKNADGDLATESIKKFQKI